MTPSEPVREGFIVREVTPNSYFSEGVDHMYCVRCCWSMSGAVSLMLYGLVFLCSVVVV